MESLALMPKYEAYKESGVDWLGEVPDCWDLVPIRGLLNFRNEKNDPIVTEDVLSLSIANGVTQYSDEGRGGNKRKDDLTAYKIARPNDIVMNSMNVIVGAVGVSKYFGAISPVYYALYAKDDSVLISFYERIFQNEGFQRGLLRLGKGILIKFGDSGKMNTIRMKISQNDLKVLMFPKPDSKTQLLISNFLDQKTAQIDEAIAIKEQQISLLKERKQIIIQQAVTQGLDPNVPMKDSGVDWIGEIPEHWDLKPLTKVIFVQEGPGIMAVDFHEEGVPLVRISGVKSETVTLDGCNYLKPSKVRKKWNHFKLRKGDLVISGSASTELVSEVECDAEGAILYTGLIRVTPREKNVIKEYLKVFFGTQLFFTQIDLQKTGSTISHYGPSHLSRMFILLPDISEQKRIVSYVNMRKQEIMEAIGLLERQIEKLKEYKTTLINSAVTGKIKITPEMIEQ